MSTVTREHFDSLMRANIKRFKEATSAGSPPFSGETPNRTTRRAMRELEEGKGETFESAEALFKELGI